MPFNQEIQLNFNNLGVGKVGLPPLVELCSTPANGSAFQCLCSRFARHDRSFHEALPIGQMLSRKQNFAMWLLQNRTQREPLSWAVERVSALRVGVALPRHRLNVCRQLGCSSI